MIYQLLACNELKQAICASASSASLDVNRAFLNTLFVGDRAVASL